MSASQSYVISVSMGAGIYRHIRIDAKETLEALSDAILDAFAFFDDHAHAFFMNNRAWDDSEAYYCSMIEDLNEDANVFTSEITLAELDLTPRQQFIYIFDFGEEWRFHCRCLRVLPEATPEPEVVRSVGDPPEQYPDSDWDDD